jgi:hypothetical protein
MAKETLKEKIARLEAENKQLREEKKADMEAVLNLNNEIVKMQETADQDFASSPYFKQLEEKCNFQAEKISVQEKRLKQEVEKNEALIDKIEALEAEISGLKASSTPKPHNERNAGRKPKADEKTIALIKMYRAQGMTIKAIQKETGLSYGVVQKHCKIS